jgi:hypothetical protein
MHYPVFHTRYNAPDTKRFCRTRLSWATELVNAKALPIAGLKAGDHVVTRGSHGSRCPAAAWDVGALEHPTGDRFDRKVSVTREGGSTAVARERRLSELRAVLNQISEVLM